VGPRRSATATSLAIVLPIGKSCNF
jgi:hypothetical protein